jgi:FkbM family methyltransferase
LWIRIPEGFGKGLWIYADPRLERGYTNGDHEPWLQEILKSELRPGDCFYDVGAHTGFFAMIAFRFVGPSGRIIAFEPDPDNAAALKANLSKNGISAIRLIESAVWSSGGEITFERAAAASNRTSGHIATEANPQLALTVPAVRLDDVIFELGYPHPHLIKIDVEGAEWAALHGAFRILNEVKPKLLCEIHDPSQKTAIQDYLRQFGYEVEEWSPRHPNYADYQQMYIWAAPGACKG